MKARNLLFIALAFLSIKWTSAQTPSPTINGVPPPYIFNGTGVSQSGQTFTFSSSGGGDAITSPHSTIAVGGSAGATTLDLAGSVGQIMAGATPALTFTPVLGIDGTSAGTLQTANGGSAAHTIWGSAATTSNTILGFVTVPTNGHVVTCTVSGSTCTLTDGGAPGTGTVTAIGVATANGVSGTSSGGTTPNLTITLGAITPSTVNGLTFTARATGFSVAGGTTSKTLTISNSLTFAGTDATTMTFPATSATVAGLGIAQTFSALNTYSAGINLSGTTSPLEVAGSAGTLGNCFLSAGPAATPTWGSCGSGSSAFSALTSSTNTTAAMVVGTGASLGVSGSGTIAATSVPVSGITGLGTGVATFLATPSSANLASALTDETGSGAAVFATSPTLVSPLLGTPTSGVITNLTGTCTSCNVGGTASNLSGTPALPNGTAATTQTVGDNTTKLATDAFVLANASGSGNVSDGSGTTTTPEFAESTSTLHLIQYRTPTQALGDMGAAAANTNQTTEGTSFSASCAGNSYYVTASVTVTLPSAVCTGGIMSFQVTSGSTLTVTSGTVTYNGPSTVLGPASFTILTDGTNFNAAWGNASTLAGKSAPSGAIVGTSDTQTLTNKSISGAQINSGTVPCAQQPALTGNVTTSAGSCATTVAAAPLSAVTGLGTGVATALAVNTGTAGAFGVLIASGTAAMNTGAVASGACETVVTVSATGVATTDTITVGFNGDPTAVTGYGASSTGAVLSIYPYPTSGNVNFKVCNSTSASITPGALTLNWRVVR